MLDTISNREIFKRREAIPTLVLRSETPVVLEDLISSIACSNIDRRTNGIVSLFLCHITPSCRNTELKKFKDVTRLDIDLASGEIHVWHLLYTESKPDVVIENGISPAGI